MRRFGHVGRYHDLILKDDHLTGVLVQTACKTGMSFDEMGYWAFFEESNLTREQARLNIAAGLQLS